MNPTRKKSPRREQAPSLNPWNDDCLWVNQEMRKGTWVATIATMGSIASRDAGWGFNSYYDSSPTNAAQLTDAQLRTNSFFMRFDDVTLYNLASGSNEAADIHVRAKVLADGIPPSRMLPAGRMEFE